MGWESHQTQQIGLRVSLNKILDKKVACLDRRLLLTLSTLLLVAVCQGLLSFLHTSANSGENIIAMLKTFLLMTKTQAVLGRSSGHTSNTRERTAVVLALLGKEID